MSGYNLVVPRHTLKTEMIVLSYDKKSDEGSNSVRMRPENSGALKVVKK